MLIGESNSEYTARIEIESIGGLRDGEVDSILMNCVKLADRDNPFVEIEIKKSKTKPRPIKLYSEKSQERIKTFYDKRISEGANPADKFFTKGHGAFRQYLKRLGKRILNKHIHPHMLRASAVTNNIEAGLIVNESEMNTFYGWEHGTGTCRRYVNSDNLTLNKTDKRAKEQIFGENTEELFKKEKTKMQKEIEKTKKDREIDRNFMVKFYNEFKKIVDEQNKLVVLKKWNLNFIKDLKKEQI